MLEAAHLFPGAILQIGLQLPLFNAPALWAIAQGEADAQAREMAAWYASLLTPVLLRLGHEFDGDAWNGYDPRAYIAAYRRIAGLLAAAQRLWSTQGHPFPAPFDQPFYVILNLSVGGNYDQNRMPGSMGGPLEARMEVDYVRVYKPT